MYEYGHIIKTSLLNINNHFDVDIFTSTRDFLTHLESFPDYTVFIIDVLLGNSNGVDIARTVTQVKKGAQIIFVSIDIETVKDIFDVKVQYLAPHLLPGRHGEVRRGGGKPPCRQSNHTTPKNAACCDGLRTALRWPTQRAAKGDAPQWLFCLIAVAFLSDSSCSSV